jgi:hypothetical protein
MLLLAGLCLGIGLLPVIVLRPARLIAIGLMGGPDVSAIGDAAWMADAMRITALGVGLLALIAGLLLVRRWLPVPGRLRLAPTWGCAAPALSPRMQYTASSYAALLLGAYGPLSGVRTSRTAGSFHSSPADPVQDWVVLPAWRRLGAASLRLRALQGGKLRWYLLSVIFTLLALLFYLTTAGRAP